MALKVINKTNSRLTILLRKNKFLTPVLSRLLYNALIQRHFDYALPAWYSNLVTSSRKWKKIQIMQIKCIRYCLQLDKTTHISKNEFENLKWLPVNDRFNQSINLIIFKYFTNRCPGYLNEAFELACLSNLRTRNSYLKLTCPFRKTNMRQTHSLLLVRQYRIKPQGFQKNPAILVFSEITEKNVT